MCVSLNCDTIKGPKDNGVRPKIKKKKTRLFLLRLKNKIKEKSLFYFFQTHYGRRKERSRGKNRWMAPRESLMRQLGLGYAHLVYYTLYRYTHTHTKSIQESKMAVCCTIRRVGRAAALY